MPASTATAATKTETFNYTGAAQTWTVPPGITEATFDLYGAQGGQGFFGPAGLGGRATATISVTPGDPIQVNVGGQGSVVVGQGAFNGGGTSGDSSTSASGGGASDVRVGGTGLTERVLVAGGGGGGGDCAPHTAGGGGGLVGEDAVSIPDWPQCSGFTLGRGGSQTEGGSAIDPATPGVFGVGGGGGLAASGPVVGNASGGGGGGWYGGGGGTGGAGGGGGSGYGPAGTVFETGVRSGNGLAKISYELDPAPVTTITSGPEGVITNASPSFAFESDQPGSTFECSLDGAAFSSCASPQGYADLADGEHAFAVRATNDQLTTDETPATREFSVDTSASGSASAKAKQRQSKSKIVVKVKVGAPDEPLTTKAKGKIKAGRKGFKLTPQKLELGAGETKTLKLRPKKDQDRIVKALAEGTSVQAKLQVKFTDPVGNTALDKPQVKLTG